MAIKISELLQKVLKSTKNGEMITKSKVLNDRDRVPTSIPAINIALSGDVNGGMQGGLMTIAGASRHFKTLFMLVLMKSYMDHYPESIAVLYDSEFGASLEYFDSVGIDMERVVHVPVTNIEELKFEAMKLLNDLERGDRVFIGVDSVGGLPSKKEVEDAIDAKSVADMTRAKAAKSLGRLITPMLGMLDIPMVLINHVYQELCLAGDTRVMTIDGPKNISDIDIGEIVYTANGTSTVINCIGPDVLNPIAENDDKKFVELSFDDGSVVRCTHDHKFLMNDGSWKRAIDIAIGEVFK